MNTKLLTALMMITSAVTFAQTPCSGGTAGGYPCEGYDLLSFIPWTTFNATNANDSWGWVDPQDGKEYALVGVRNGVAFVDITDPVNPVYLGKLATHTGGSLWRDLKVYNNFVFVVSEASGHGMQIFDLTRLRNVTNPPENFSEDAHYAGFGSAHNVVINESEGYAYAVGTSTFSGGPHFVDITDPLNPVAAGGYSAAGYSHDGQVITYNGPDTDYTGREIYIGSNTDEVVIADVTDKTNPQTISTISYSNIAYTHQGWVTDDHEYFVLGDEIDELNFGFNTRTVIFDISDLDNPGFDFEYFGPTPATDHNGYVKGNEFYLAGYKAGLRVMDISDIENGNITETGYFDVYPTNDTSGYDGAWNVYPYFPSGNILITSLTFSDGSYLGGMFIVRSQQLSTEDFALKNSIKISPNPTKDNIDIISSDITLERLQISDVLGQVLFSEDNLDTLNKTIDISSYSEGIYFVNINNSLTKKIIKQ
ncbi:MAG: choice-of-anchor B family protein [Bacteroidota bacterium]